MIWQGEVYSMSKEITLSQGKVAYVDDEDFAYLSQFHWFATKGPHTWYARRKKSINGRQLGILMHREILDAPKGILVDHIDHDGLNNQRINLRLCSQAENQHNQRLRCGTSKYKGVFQRGRGKWHAQLRVNDLRLHLGDHDTEEDAARAYDAKAKEIFGVFAFLNFP
jgi:HNH endonuclease